MQEKFTKKIKRGVKYSHRHNAGEKIAALGGFRRKYVELPG